jgi:hypothetical protein
MQTNTSAQSKQLKEILERYQALHRICQMEEYRLHLKPILEEAFKNKWPDPSQSKSTKEFHKQYTEQYGKAMAFRELFNMIEGAEKLANNLTQEMAKPKSSYGLE